MEVGPPKGKGAPAGEPNAMAAGASKYLANLPSRGLFSSPALSSNLGGVRVYVCVHDTSPPGEQLIKTNQTNILIRSLTLKKQKGESGAKDIKVKVAAENTNGKRSAERPVEARTSAKRANTTSSTGISRQEGSNSRPTEEFHNLTVERLRALLKERGLSTKGKKDELISRLKENGRGEK